jgi:hypothetical protein
VSDVDKDLDRYLMAQFHMGVMAGSLRRPLSEEATKALEFFNRLVEDYLGHSAEEPPQ